MIDLLFVEVGAVVTEILSPTRCTFEPFCSPKEENKPTFGIANRVTMDFRDSLDSVLKNRGSDSIKIAAQRAWCDHDKQNAHGSTQIGSSWPGGEYEGVVWIGKDFVDANTTLAAAVATLPGQPWEHQVVVSIDEATIDEATRVVRRYHGFHAKLLRKDGDALFIEVAHAGRSAEADSPWTTIPYDPADTTKFYTGTKVATNILSGDFAPGSFGAVFIERGAAAAFAIEEPKLPPGAGGAVASRPRSRPLSVLPKPPSLSPDWRVEAYFVLSVADAQNVCGSMDPMAIAVQRALGDRIGPSVPGDSYEGLMYIREDVVRANAALALAVATLPGHLWERQAIVAINAVTGALRRYHGFHAEILEDQGDVLVLEIANTGMSTSSPRKTIRYDPRDTTKFYAGELVVENVVKSGQAPGSTGAVFITPEAAERLGVEVADLLPGARDAASFTVMLPELAPGTEAVARIDVLLPTLPPIAHAATGFDLPLPGRHPALDSGTALAKEAIHG